MQNYFDFFGLPVSPSVDRAQLKRTFLANSKRFHPDFHTLSDEATQEDALEQSTTNNRGYKVLNNEDQRLKHFLDVHGALGEEGTNTVPQDFLMEIMEVNEALMELEFDDDPMARLKVEGLIAQLEKDLQGEVAPVLAAYDPEQPDESSINALRDYYLKQRYLMRLRQKI
ncbi:iron-sulfur cluster co-chaperone HscB C-terminal domain-containing protein [Lewinella sp. 4G2]|uniref:iron-sulfur cluster co-chaperone HscB C-terminal domain-containing protein n=1 Tax=Lewinella sp. 4G2 TaxID=1803372 RepID=UPI0007B46E5C|nr:iron-sulfur cluster co-chaperone HscB C-terminal domain-containing protein [Lewinella sp. 4G2]OAV46233.1 hypothetical protein A3850_018430 [Lewinella sp. 4G2]